MVRRMVADSLKAGRISVMYGRSTTQVSTVGAAGAWYPAKSMGMRVAIVGCGMIGRKRAAALGDCRLTVCCDTDLSRAEALGAAAVSDWRAAVSRPMSTSWWWRRRTTCWLRSRRRRPPRESTC